MGGQVRRTKARCIWLRKQTTRRDLLNLKKKLRFPPASVRTLGTDDLPACGFGRSNCEKPGSNFLIEPQRRVWG
jgi:hypothetical protein